MKTLANDRNGLTLWFARAAVGLAFVLNMDCALTFLLQPGQYTGAFELGGVPGRLVIQSLGILFLMWNVTYPAVLFRPDAQQTLFAVILAQQLIGVAGETCLWLQLPAGHPALYQTGQRFILFDGLGLLAMAAAYWSLSIRVWPVKTQAGQHG